MTSLFDLSDSIGPAKILHVSNPSVGLQGIVVVDNVACGPAIGGTRMAVDVTVSECARLARAMTYKNAAAALPHGGAKSVIIGDPAMPAVDKERLIRAFACAIEGISDYIPGPDMGTDEICMAWINDEIGRSVGLPRVIGGIPLDEIGATGFGVAVATDVAQEFCDVRIEGARVAVQGFGAVGQHAARQLVNRGAILVAAADSHATVINGDGIDVEALVETKRQVGRLAAHPSVATLDRSAIVAVDCDIWIPAARPDVLSADNVAKLKARLVVQGANIPATDAAEQLMHQRGILSVPDFIANAGGVICASVEYHGGSQTVAIQTIEEKVRINTFDVLTRARSDHDLPRAAAIAISKSRIRQAMGLRRH